MDDVYIYQCIKEFMGTQPGASSGCTANILEAALFVEDTFGISLSDEEICRENLGSHETLVRFVIEKMKDR